MSDDKKWNKLAIISFILSFIPILRIGGLVMAIISLKQIKEKNEKGKGLAIAAIILSVIFMLFTVFFAAPIMMASFGVMSPERLIPERCDFAIDIPCVGKASVKTNSVQFALRNNLDTEIFVNGASFSGNECNNVKIAIGSTGQYQNINSETSIPKGEIFKFIADCNLKSNSKYEDDFTLSYIRDDVGLKYDLVGTIRSKVS
jgi:hypothetical protein